MVSIAKHGIKTLSIRLTTQDYEWIKLLKKDGESWESFMIRAAQNQAAADQAT